MTYNWLAAQQSGNQLEFRLETKHLTRILTRTYLRKQTLSLHTQIMFAYKKGCSQLSTHNVFSSTGTKKVTVQSIEMPVCHNLYDTVSIRYNWKFFLFSLLIATGTVYRKLLFIRMHMKCCKIYVTFCALHELFDIRVCLHQWWMFISMVYL